MRVAVLTMTRDRLAYTKHCHRTLLDHAGTEFDWYVVDQGSVDGTADWLRECTEATVVALPNNIGICPALNLMLEEMLNPDDYDVIVRVDNDAELTTPNTLLAAAEVACEHGWIIAPRVRGLLNPPPSLPAAPLGDYLVSETTILGGIFMAIPADLFSDHEYRYDERHPPYSGDEAICGWWRANGGHCGYLEGYDVNHYLTSAGQHEDQPEYQQRKMAEMGLA